MSAPGRDPALVDERRLHRARDRVHLRHRPQREGARRGLGREHDRGRAVEDRVCDVGHLRPRRLGLVDHRLEHLRRGDHRATGVAGTLDDSLLDERHLRDADLDAEVAPRHHDRVRRLDDRVEVHDRLGLLDLRDDPSRRAGRVDQRAQLRDVVGRRGRTRARRSRRRPRARTARSTRSFSVSAGIGSGDEGRLTPFEGLIVPPTSTRQSSRVPSLRLGASRIRPSSISTSSPGATTSARRAAKLTPSSPARARSGAVRTSASPAATCIGSLQPGDADLRAAEVGEHGDRPPEHAPARCAPEARRSACSSCEPCEKFSRATSMPAAASSKIVSGSFVAGPSVQTIFVRRMAGRADRRRDRLPRFCQGEARHPVTSLLWLLRSSVGRSAAGRVRDFPSRNP